MTRLFANDASSTLAQGINNVDDPVTFDVLDGDKFPQLAGDDTFIVTLQNSAGALEILEITARSGNTLTGTRAQEGTVALPFSIGDRCEIRTTAGTLGGFVQQNAPLDLNGNALSGANADSSCTWTGGEMSAGVYRAADGLVSNAIVIPDGDGDPTLRGDRILTAGSLSGTPDTDLIYKAVYPVGIVIFFADDMDPNLAKGKPNDVTWEKVQADGRYIEATTTGKSAGNPPATADHENGTFTLSDGTGGHTHEDVGDFPPNSPPGHALTLAEIPGHDHQTERTGTEANFILPAPTNTSLSADPGGLGTNAAAKYRTGFSGGWPGDSNVRQDAALPHVHRLDTTGAHVHTIDNPKPRSVLLVPWRRKD